MAGVKCKDIFQAVYVNVRGSYINSFYTSKVKSRSTSEERSEDEDLQKTLTDEPKSEKNFNTKEVLDNSSETVKESIERLAEEDVVADIRLDLEGKFPFALGAVCNNLATIDKLYREHKGHDEQEEFSEYFIDIEDMFPLSEVFVYPCIMFVSSMALIDVDEERSDDFYDKYASSVSAIVSQIPYKTSKMVEKYPY